ncbi:9604_t:CDS:2 [Diversispora eburnea]|uniref:9604_t:CDS:1 n=1 Tax=Diversispora eburnea TaxID=1213867 RepID=A0A9N8Z6A7_9GLOM|nr:9604_t:CDS:2 [Diversispora eburnea]
MPPTRNGRIQPQFNTGKAKQYQKLKSQKRLRTPFANFVRDPYIQLENELQRERSYLQLILEHIDNQKLKLKTEEAVLLTILDNHNQKKTTNDILIPISTNNSYIGEEGNQIIDNNIIPEFINSINVQPFSRQSSPELSDNALPDSYINKITFNPSNTYEDQTINWNDKGSSILNERQSNIINSNSTDIEIANALSILENMSDDEDEEDDDNIKLDEMSPTETVNTNEDRDEYISDECEEALSKMLADYS